MSCARTYRASRKLSRAKFCASCLVQLVARLLLHNSLRKLGRAICCACFLVLLAAHVLSYNLLWARSRATCSARAPILPVLRACAVC